MSTWSTPASFSVGKPCGGGAQLWWLQFTARWLEFGFQPWPIPVWLQVLATVGGWWPRRRGCVRGVREGGPGPRQRRRVRRASGRVRGRLRGAHLALHGRHVHGGARRQCHQLLGSVTRGLDQELEGAWPGVTGEWMGEGGWVSDIVWVRGCAVGGVAAPPAERWHAFRAVPCRCPPRPRALWAAARRGRAPCEQLAPWLLGSGGDAMAKKPGLESPT